MKNIKEVLDRLGLEDTGRYDKHFYVITIENSDEYARMFTKLDAAAINTEEPNFESNTNGTTIKVTNYFELDVGTDTYNLFLFADFENDKYYLKIGEKTWQ